MFNNQPRALYPLALTNTGERFGYYIMLSVLVLYLQAKFGFDENTAGLYYSVFLAGVYFMPVIGGWFADRVGLGKCVVVGIGLLLVGYTLISLPLSSDFALPLVVIALTIISIGTGFFKGNLLLLFGNLYENEQYAKSRESGFSLYYMANNIGAMFAPAAVTKITNSFLASKGLYYSANVASLANQFKQNTISIDNQIWLQQMADTMGWHGDLLTFSDFYISALSHAYNIGFAVAVGSLLLSLTIYFVFRVWFKHADYNGRDKNVAMVELTPQQTRSRIMALCAVFAVVIFFWMAFHQNGTSLTYFARDYTATEVVGWVRMGFNIGVLAMIAVIVYLIFGAWQSKNERTRRMCSINAVVLLVAIYFMYQEMGSVPLHIQPQEFQQFNPFFVIALTPISLLIFDSLRQKGKEPSAPMKIALGMLVAAFGYLILLYCSVGLPAPAELDGRTCATPVVPQYLIATYLVLTFAELLLSPMGQSFVSKVAPPKYKGVMMGCWFASGAIGNYLSRIPSLLWKEIPLWLNWTILAILCLISAGIMFAILNKINEATR